jgi:hypothetical protein
MWPVHPQPLEGESMESWVTRQAFANCYSIQEFATTYLGQSSYHYFDLDFLDENSTAFRVTEGVVGGKDRALRMTINRFKSVLGPKRSDLLYWTTVQLQGRAYCPICFSEDKTAYLRVLWRLGYIPVCLEHNVLLSSRCGNCQATVAPWRANASYDLKRCFRCGSSLSSTPTHYVDGGLSRIAAVVVRLLTDAAEAELKEMKWEYGPAQLFQTLKFLTMVLKQVEIKPKSSIRGHLRNPLLALQMLRKAWTFLQDWPRNIEPFIADNQSTFNYIARARRFCPMPLKPYIMLRKKIDWGSIYTAIDELARKEQRVTRAKVARITGCSFSNLRSAGVTAHLRHVRERTLESTRRRNIQAVRRALAGLEKDERYPAFDAVKRLSGVGTYSRAYLRKLVIDRQRKYQEKSRREAVAKLKSALRSPPPRWGHGSWYPYLANELGLKPNRIRYHFRELIDEARQRRNAFWVAKKDERIPKQTKLLQKAIRELVSMNKAPTINALGRRLQVSATALRSRRYLVLIIEEAVRKHQERKRKRKSEILAKLRAIVASQARDRRITYRYLLKRLGLPRKKISWLFQDPDVRKLKARAFSR